MAELDQQTLDMLCINNKNEPSKTLSALFQSDPERFTGFSRQAREMLFDFSRTSIDKSVLAELLELANSSPLASWRTRLFSGVPFNVSEDSPAHHPLLRESTPENTQSGKDVGECVGTQRQAMLTLGMALHSGIMPGYQHAITDVIHLGMGGSVLGQQLVVEALQNEATSQINVHFLASADGWALNAFMRELQPQHTLVVAASKSFTTREIQLNMKSLQEWLQQGSSGGDASSQMIAITAQPDRARAAGFIKENILQIPQTVGGRFSLWSAMGLPIVIRYGDKAYLQLLAGAENMDRHFRDSDWSENIPVLAALVTIWQRNVRQYPAVAVVTYDSRLRMLPAWLQQLDMESAGKSVDCQGKPLSHPAAPVVFGGTGTDAQHAFFQALYQGMEVVPVEFIGVVNFRSEAPHASEHSRFQLTNMLAQADALAFAGGLETNGQVEDKLAHQAFSGNRPSTLMLIDTLTPMALGELLAFYEHRIYALSAIWGNNPFDQFGVEYGKQLSIKLESMFDEDSSTESDPHSSLHQWVVSKLKR